jgi:predicted permease
LSVQLLENLTATMAPVLITAAVGFGWGKAGLPFDTDHITRLITLVGTPCLVVSSLLKVSPAMDTFGAVALIAGISHMMMGLFGFLLLKGARLPHKAYLPSMIFANNGNMGLPLCFFAFGESGLALGIAYLTVSALGQFTVGQALAAGPGARGKVWRTPIIWAVAAAMILMVTDTHLPRWADNTISLIGQLTIPLMLLALGVSLSRLRVTTFGRSAALAGFRVGGGLALAVLLAKLFGLEGEERGVVLIQGSMPTAVFNYLFAQFYSNRPDEIAGIVVISTAMSFALLPFLLAVVM